METVLDKLTQKNDKKLLLLVIDGIGGAPYRGKTELEAAYTPNMDRLAKSYITGVADPVAPGITPGSGPGHLALFGYDPLRYEIGRGILEALGVGLEVTPKDVAVRGNFATIDDNGIIIDRRAGRISTDLNRQLCTRIQQEIKVIDGVEIIVKPGKEHRFVLILRGDKLSDKVTETDPQKEGNPPLRCEPLVPEATHTAEVVNKFVDAARKLLNPPANFVLLRGFAKHPQLKSMRERFKLTPAGIATYPMYKGLAKLVGMDILETGPELEDEIETLRKNWDNYDFFYFHIKRTDSLGEDGNWEAKVELIEKIDKLLPDILDLHPDVLVITGDHSTPAILKAHSWHPVPVLFVSPYVIPDKSEAFNERECMHGGLGRIRLLDLLPLMLAHGLKLKKYGA